MQSGCLVGGHDGRCVRGAPVGVAFEGWYEANLAIKSGRVVSVDLFDGCELCLVSGFPRATPTDPIDAVIPAAASRLVRRSVAICQPTIIRE